MRRLTPGVLVVFIAACGPSSPPEPFHGSWKVTNVSTPGVSAVTSGGGVPVGTAVEYAAGDASFGDRSCDDPIYTRRSLSAETFLEAYRVTPQQLALTGDPIALVDVTCGSGSLDAGSTLILKADGSMLTVWDGAFYELRKQ